MPDGGAGTETCRRPYVCIAWPLGKVTVMPVSTWDSTMRSAEACPRTTVRASDGISKLRNSGIQRPRGLWATAVMKALAYDKTSRPRLGGIAGRPGPATSMPNTISVCATCTATACRPVVFALQTGRRRPLRRDTAKRFENCQSWTPDSAATGPSYRRPEHKSAMFRFSAAATSPGRETGVAGGSAVSPRGLLPCVRLTSPLETGTIECHWGRKGLP